MCDAGSIAGIKTDTLFDKLFAVTLSERLQIEFQSKPFLIYEYIIDYIFWQAVKFHVQKVVTGSIFWQAAIGCELACTKSCYS